MSGHSKWATIKHKKATTDARRGKLFTKILKEITVAARLGGGDAKGNPRLRAAVLEARSNSVPNDNIDRAIKKGTGELESEVYEEVIYEGYGPAGVAILVEAATDNRNRTAGEVRHTFARNGGSLGEAGCVAWMFHRRGYFAVEKSAMDEEKFMELALELGADDVAIEEDVYEIYTPMEELPHHPGGAGAPGGPHGGQGAGHGPPDHRRRARRTRSTRCCGWWTPWRTTTTSRRSGPTSTSTRRSWRRSPGRALAERGEC